MAEPDIIAAKEYARRVLKLSLEAGWLFADAGRARRASELKSRAMSFKIIRGEDEGDEHASPVVDASWSEKKVKELIRDAGRGDATAHRAVCEIITEHLKDQSPLQPPLLEFALELLNGTNPNNPKPKRGWEPADRYSRDFCIKKTVEELMSGHGLNRTRDPKRTKAPSACSIVAEVLAELGVERIAEKAIEKITTKPRDAS